MWTPESQTIGEESTTRLGACSPASRNGDIRVGPTGGLREEGDRVRACEVAACGGAWATTRHGRNVGSQQHGVATVVALAVGLLLAAEIGHAQTSPAILQEALDTFAGTLPSAGIFRGSFDNSMAFGVLAKAHAEGNSHPDIVPTLVKVVKALGVNSAYGPRFDNGLEFREGGGAIFALALCWNSPAVMAQLTQTEKDRIQTVARASLAYSAFYLAEYDQNGNYRGSPQPHLSDGQLNVWDRTGPNYYEGKSMAILAATEILGVAAVVDYANTFRLTNLVNELNARGFSTAANNFAATWTQGSIDCSTLAKKATWMENTLRNITWNDGQGRKFYKGMTFQEFLTDPVRVQRTELVNFSAGKPAREGDYIGQTGMMHEFDSTDAYGVRDSVWYSGSSLPATTCRQFMIEHFGHWSASSNSDFKNTIRTRARVAFSDIQSKAFNGYWSRRQGANAHDGLNNKWFRAAHDFAITLGWAKRHLLFDSFGDKSRFGPAWTSVGTWSQITATTWTGRSSPLQSEQILQTDNGDNRFRVADLAQTNANLRVQMKYSSGGSGGAVGLAGRFNSARTHGYLLRFVPAAGKAQIVSVANGAETILAEANHSLSSGTLVFLRGEFNGDTIRMYANSNLVVQTMHTAHNGTWFGLYSHQAVSQFDDAFFTVVAYEASAVSPPVCSGPPPAPGGLQAVPGVGQITVSWDEEGCATSYTLFRDGAAIAAGLVATSFADTNVVVGSNYCYAVRSVSTNGVGPLSSNVCVTAGAIACDGPPGAVEPEAVGGEGQVQVFWPAVACAGSYTVFRDGQAIAAGLVGTNYTDVGVSNGVTYCYAVRALNTNGPGPLSGWVCATPQGGTGLVGHWAFEEGSGMTTADLSGQGNTGTLVGAVGWTNGIVGDFALNFPGLSSARVEMSADSASLQITGAVTLAAWVWPGVANQSAHLVGRAGGSGARGYQLLTEGAGGIPELAGAYGLRVSSNGSATVAVTLYTPTNVMRAGEWMHVVGVFDPAAEPSAMRIYTNGWLCAEMSTSSKFMNVPAGIQPRIGARGDNTGGFNGRIDEARIYNRALSAVEVLELYRGGVVPAVPVNLTATVQFQHAWLEWEPVAGAQGYVVLRSLASGGPYAPVATNASPGVWDTGLAAGTTYYYVVRAWNQWGESEDSEEVQVSTPAASPVRVLSLQVASVGADQVVTVEAQGTPGYGYGLERIPSLSEGVWSHVQTQVASTNAGDAGRLRFQDTNPPSPAFYRVRHPPGP